jgi:N utilization substance protein B
MIDRRAARILAMQALCQWDVQKEESSAELYGFFAEQEADPAVARYAGQLVEAFWNQRQVLDGALQVAARNWSLERMPAVDRNTLRVALVEMRNGLIPPKVALDEALEIVREFGGCDSARFVNGVLDALLRQDGESTDGGLSNAAPNDAARPNREGS